MATVETHRPSVFSYLSLFTSLSTLLCCALPSLLVLLGLGATVASFLSVAPWLVTLSRHKAWVFAGSGALIALNGIYVYRIAPRLRGELESCAPDDPAACETADTFRGALLWMSALIYFVGVFTAYVLGPLLVRFG